MEVCNKRCLNRTHWRHPRKLGYFSETGLKSWKNVKQKLLFCYIPFSYIFYFGFIVHFYFLYSKFSISCILHFVFLVGSTHSISSICTRHHNFCLLTSILQPEMEKKYSHLYLTSQTSFSRLQDWTKYSLISEFLKKNTERGNSHSYSISDQ